MGRGRKPVIIPAAIALLDSGFAGDAEECAKRIWGQPDGWRWQARWKSIREAAADQSRYVGVAQIGPRRIYLMISNEEQAIEHIRLVIKDLANQYNAKLPQMVTAAQSFPKTAELTQPTLTGTRRAVLDEQITIASSAGDFGSRARYEAEKQFSKSMNGDE